MDKQKDFEMGWEEYKAKSKQEIEEMICIIQNAVGGCAEHLAKLIAEELHKNRYRKIHDGAVVILDEEMEDFAEMFAKSPQMQEVMYGLIKAWRKETAEEFAEAIRDCYPPRIDPACTIDDRYMLDRIDEICKEITEGKV